MTNAAESIGPWLQNAGYTTAMIGKYPYPYGAAALAGWNMQRTFVGATDQSAYGYQVFDGTSTVTHSEYQADYVFEEARNFAATAPGPWFCWLTPTNPHVDYNYQFIPRPQDVNEYLDLIWPVVDDEMTGKPSWMQTLAPMSSEGRELVRVGAIGQLQELRSVDDGMASLFATLSSTGQLANTIVIFTSDNGVMYGEHRVFGFVPSLKNAPYEASMHVPLLAHGPGFNPMVNATPVCAQDITKTCVTVALTASPGIPLDGRDLRVPDANRVLLHERSGGPVPGMPDGVGVSTQTRKLWRHEADDPDRYEMYLLDSDPDELVNVAYDPLYLDERNALEAELDLQLA
jgi:arylsulfatase A-like enzyme